MTLNELLVAVKAALKVRGYPFEIVYGPTQVPLAVGATRIQLARDIEAGDQVRGPTGAHVNARHYATRAVGGVLRVFAHSTITGPMRHDHEDLADQIVDAVHVAMHKTIRDGKATWRMIKAGFVTNVETPNGWAGVVYELRFQLDRGVADLKWTGEATPTGTFSTAKQSLDTSGPATETALPAATTRVS